MKYKANSRRRALEYEADMIKFWKENKIFEKSVENRSKDNAYVFYDGPPFITGVPHHGTLLSSIVKDAVPRYQTMKGKRVERVWGWDCHGLPAENFTEKKLGITDRHVIGNEIPLETYITTCRDNMVSTSDLWENTIDRIGRWVEFKNAYKTMDKEYMESVWWAFKELYKKGKIYEGEKVLMYDTKWATPLSKAEVTMDAGAYQEVTDPSIYVKFKVIGANEAYRQDLLTKYAQRDQNADGIVNPKSVDKKDRNGDGIVNKYSQPVYLLAWTTTPWTLPSNVVLAVHPDLDYVELEHKGEVLIMAKDLVEKVMTDEKHQPLEYQILGELKGADLVGVQYEPLFDNHGEKAHQVYPAEYVSAEDGTGIVHTAPAYGEEDFNLAKQFGFPVVHRVDDYGNFTSGTWEGKNLWDVNKEIAKTVLAEGKALKIDYIRHEYPHNTRTGERLIYRAHPSWFMDILGQKEKMLENNQPINWFPEHIKHGRFAKTIAAAPDWNLSRDRFWASAMPVWEGIDENGKKHQIVVGSYAELKELSGVELEDYHRPWVDEIEFDKDGVHYKRIDKVLDCWFESGSMPFAQFHYPFENKEKFEASFPGDFIVEYVGQVRAWFYYVHAVATGLFGTNGFKNVIVTGTVAGNDGRKMSKSYGNYTDPNELMDKFSADSLRFLLLQSPLLSGEDFALIDKDVSDVARKLTMIWNMYDFFTMYAEVDDFTFPYFASSSDAFLVRSVSNTARSDTPASSHNIANEKSSVYDIDVDLSKLTNELDIWIVSRLHQLNEHITENMDKYDIPNAMKPILPFIEDASNWYVRRSRRRFWKSGDDADKADAYRTLHYVLMKLSVILAPFTPFLSEELYQKMGGGNESVHLLDWPTNYSVNQQILDQMEQVREIVNLGLNHRNKAQIKVRQPLAKVTIKTSLAAELDGYQDLIKEELNVKIVELVAVDDEKQLEVELETELTEELKQEGLVREVIRAVQSARKKAGLNVDDRIELELATVNSDLAEAINNFADLIKAEVLATKFELRDNMNDDFSSAQANKIEFGIKLRKL